MISSSSLQEKFPPEIQNSSKICFFREWLSGIMWAFEGKKKNEAISSSKFFCTYLILLLAPLALVTSQEILAFCTVVFVLYLPQLRLTSYNLCLCHLSLNKRSTNVFCERLNKAKGPNIFSSVGHTLSGAATQFCF